MEGIVYKTKYGWALKCYDGKEFLIHPSQIKLAKSMNGTIVEFDLVDEFNHPHMQEIFVWGYGQKYAFLSDKKKYYAKEKQKIDWLVFSVWMFVIVSSFFYGKFLVESLMKLF